jgi:uncharacterized protein (TIGR03435 family)
MKARFLFALLLAGPPRALPQSPASAPTFDVVSVKRGCGGRITAQSDPGRLTLTCITLESLISLAYGLREFQYSGPQWAHMARYDIVATTNSPQPRLAQLRMLQQVLTDRFKLTIHRETRTLPVYDLVVGKSGSKLKAMDEVLPVPLELPSNFHFESVPDGTTALRGYGTLAQLCDFLYRLVERPVVDRTGITGGFDFRLMCAIDGFPGYDTSPSVFEAVQSQLGLKLEPGSSPIEITAVVHVEEPSGN